MPVTILPCESKLSELKLQDHFGHRMPTDSRSLRALLLLIPAITNQTTVPTTKTILKAIAASKVSSMPRAARAMPNTMKNEPQEAHRKVSVAVNCAVCHCANFTGSTSG